MQMHPYLLFNGQCAEALEFYKECLGGRTAFLMRYSEAPASDQPSSPAMSDKVLHASFEFPGGSFMASDAPPERYRKPQGGYLAIEAGSPEEAESLFTALGDGGSVHMPMQETFWAERFGMLADRYDIAWMISAAKPMS